MLFKLSNMNSNLALTLGYLNPVLNNSALRSFYRLGGGGGQVRSQPEFQNPSLQVIRKKPCTRQYITIVFELVFCGSSIAVAVWQCSCLHLSYNTVTRPYHLSEFTPNRTSLLSFKEMLNLLNTTLKSCYQLTNSPYLDHYISYCAYWENL